VLADAGVDLGYTYPLPLVREEQARERVAWAAAVVERCTSQGDVTPRKQPYRPPSDPEVGGACAACLPLEGALGPALGPRPRDLGELRCCCGAAAAAAAHQALRSQVLRALAEAENRLGPAGGLPGNLGGGWEPQGTSTPSHSHEASARGSRVPGELPSSSYEASSGHVTSGGGGEEGAGGGAGRGGAGGGDYEGYWGAAGPRRGGQQAPLQAQTVVSGVVGSSGFGLSPVAGAAADGGRSGGAKGGFDWPPDAGRSA
jgi:hypothetical protein